MYRPTMFSAGYERGPQPVPLSKLSLDEKPLPPIDFEAEREEILESTRNTVGNHSVGSLLSPPRPTRYPALSLENLRALKNTYTPSRNLKPEAGPDIFGSTSTTALEQMTDDSIFVGPPLAVDHPMNLGMPEPKRPRMDIPSERVYGEQNTADLAYFLKTTGPPGGRHLPPKIIQEPVTKEEQGTLKRMIGLGVSTFRKRKEPTVTEMYERAPQRGFSDVESPRPRIVQKVSKNGTKYLQIITGEDMHLDEEVTELYKANEPESPRISLEIENSNVIDVEDFEKWVSSFNVQPRDSPFATDTFTFSPADSTFTQTSKKLPRDPQKGGFGLSILESSGSELASPTGTHSSATSPTLTNDEKQAQSETHEPKSRADIGSTPTLPTLAPLDMDRIAAFKKFDQSSPVKKQEDEEWIQREMMQIQSPVRNNFQADSPVIGALDANCSTQASQSAFENARDNNIYRTTVPEDWQFHPKANVKQNLGKTSSKRSATRPSMRQSKSSHDVHHVTDSSGPRVSYTTIPPLLSPMRPKTSGERDEDITALPQITPPRAPLPITPERKKRKNSKPLPNPLSGFPVPPSSSGNGVPSPSQTIPVGQSTRSSVCSINTANSRRITFPRLQARVDHLERENRLLQAALQAVLRTSGALNGCPCKVAKSNEQQVPDGARRGSADSQSSNVSALDLYHRTRLARVSNGARSL